LARNPESMQQQCLLHPRPDIINHLLLIKRRIYSTCFPYHSIQAALSICWLSTAYSEEVSSLSCSIQAPTSLALNAFREGAFTTSLGNLFQCLTTFTVNNFFLDQITKRAEPGEEHHSTVIWSHWSGRVMLWRSVWAIFHILFFSNIGVVLNIGMLNYSVSKVEQGVECVCCSHISSESC